MLGVLGVVLLIGIPVILVISAIILRAAVSLYNKMAGARPQVPPPNYAGGYSPNVAGGADDANPFAAPTTYGSGPMLSTTGVPEPAFGRACGIVILSWLASIPVSVVVGLVASAAPETGVFLRVLSIFANFFVGAAVLKGMLPTARFGTACLIALLQLVIGAVIAVGIVAVILAFRYTIGASSL